MSYSPSYYNAGGPGSDYANSPYGTGTNTPTRSYPHGAPVVSRPTWQTEKVEEELALHIKKALSPEETAPKQKHVRACIVYTWDIKGSGSFWMAIETFPVLGDELVTFKALITAHKVIRQGHPNVLKDAIGQTGWFDTLTRSVPPHSTRGYGVLIRAYVQFLLAKLDYHRLHPEFSGTFDYEEYVTLKGVEDPNEGFETINDLLGLLDKLDSLQKLIFVNFRPSSNNEARIAALVPLVEESHGIYQFLINMLMAMHKIIGSVEVLAPLREKFNAGHYALFRFYYECSTLKYLTSLITVPRLSQDPPDFLAQGPPTLPPRGESPNKQAEIDLFNEQQAAFEKQLIEDQQREEQRLQAERELELARQRQQQQQLEAQRQLELQRQQLEGQRQQEEFRRQQEAERRRLEEERLRMQQQANAANAQLEGQLLQQRLMNAQNELEQYRNQSYRDRDTLNQYEQRIRGLEQQLSQLSLGNRDMDAAKDDLLRRLQEELAQWKQKYEALAKLYAQLRKEHLDLLNKFKDVRDSANRQSEQARKEVEKAKSDMKEKSNEVTELLIERDRLKGEVDRVRAQYEEEMSRLRRDLQDAKASLNDLSASKGAELQNIISRFEAERLEMENLNKAKQQQIDEMRRRLDDAAADIHRSKAVRENFLLSTSPLQAMIDYKWVLGAREDAAVLQAGLDQTLLALAAQQSFVKLVQTGDHKDAISSSTSFAHAVSQLLHNAKGVTRLASDDDQIDGIVRTVKTGALGGRLFFDQLKSGSLSTIETSRRPEHIVGLSRETQHQLGRMSALIEQLVVTKLDDKSNLEDEVERQMKNAADAIEEAAKRLAALMNKPRQGADLDVHSAILESAMAMMSAIALLIQRATETQQEIVAHGRGSTSTGQFYKKNNKWTEGLISAAQAVAAATTTLVECADGLISGTHSYEQLVVAAQEVSVATTQLVAASRVKSIPFSKTQIKLEDAAVAVRKATDLLVKAAKEAAKRNAESKAQDDIGRLNRHQLKVAEMEQKVKILEIEKELQTARYRLGELVKKGYRPEDDE
ncbi:uncharacterized protein SPPG_03197 [Spizellomyces punctatus DAOM BR117]|uniref:I/LWEQ domain-containing protein n=1 Tax=Spizellomyces punctatus (strain DAOM BR117) TaxID=645134 RepID=A0A0L0HIV0_SPIPD|nr:uncharacterized protein SPPG_03197 [Spizellomyces punctatus DAOM BR117]KND01386.1 hypothetical protein SPPG_03197 [Spizellomyces punctatus DAOM BR117]|eukprot:XP_016609425.1 hypothetical protein SPPG_03197 [Spizellomyces punctatus DAOM BR117]